MKIFIILFMILMIGCQPNKPKAKAVNLKVIKLSDLKNKNHLREVSIKGKRNYRVNEDIQFLIDTGRNIGYLYIFYMNNKNQISLLYPNNKSPSSKISGIYLFPRDFGGIKIIATKDCKECKEENTNIYAFLSKEPIYNIENIKPNELLNLFETKTNTRGISMDKRNIDLSSGKFDFIVTGNSIIGSISYKQKNSQSKKLKEEIRGHSYTTIENINEAKKLKNTFTYVLFPRNLMGEKQNTKKHKRYSKVLELIQELKKVEKSNHSNIATSYENKFILMSRQSDNKEKITVDSYNYNLSHQIIDFFRDKVTLSFFDKEGPFFITVTENIFEKKDSFRFLYLDLSTFNDSAITQVIESYKTRLVEKGNSNIDILEGWHYHILSTLTNFSDKFHLFNFAYAGGEE